LSRFEFVTSSRIIFGSGTLSETGALAASMGKRAFVVIGRAKERALPLLNILASAGIEAVLFQVAGEPTTTVAREAANSARSEGCDLVIGFGGGSALDIGKIVSALLTNEGEPEDYLEIIGRGKFITQLSKPYIAVPTTAGSGAEVTRNAVLASPEHRVKVSMRSVFMLPRIALVDPELTCSMPPQITASTGQDALTQVVEPYVSSRPNPLIDALCKEAMARAARSLRRAYEYGDDMAAREDMAICSLLGGLALANGRLGAVHGIAGPLGGLISISHGAVCARLLAYATEVNLRALRERAPDNPALSRYEEVARILTTNDRATPEDAVKWFKEIGADLKVPDLSAYGLKRVDLPLLVEKASVSSSMQGNPVKLTSNEIEEIITLSLGKEMG
jgi:alcohol dehydrogenase class IV